MSVTINGTNGLTFNDNTTQATSPFAGGLGFRNRIINGDMRIDQRNAGASVTPTNGQYTLDRWRAAISQTSKFSVQQTSTAPAGFTNSLLVTSTSAYSLTSTDFFALDYRVEGFNVADLGWGTANAQQITVSFWVRCSLTGTFGGTVQNAGNNRAYPFTYTISSANTYEYKTITIPGDTSGTWLTNNGIGIRLSFGLGVGATFSGTAGAWASTNLLSATGATSVVGTNGATFYITGVQLEKGSTATAFDYRPYGTELQLCQRYYARRSADGTPYTSFATFSAHSTINITAYVQYPVTMRAAPTINYSNCGAQIGGGVIYAITGVSSSYTGLNSSYQNLTTATTGFTFGQAGQVLANNNTSAYIDFSAEL